MTAGLQHRSNNFTTAAAPALIVSAFPSLSTFPPLRLRLAPDSGCGLVSWSLCPHCRKFMAPESPRPLKFPAFSQLLARDCRRGWGLPPRLRGHLLEVGSSAKCPEIGTRQETAESKIRKQVSEEGDINNPPAPAVAIDRCISPWRLSDSQSHNKHRTLSTSDSL